MSEKVTGGPAFPEKRRIYRAGFQTQEFEPVGGMTLRDYMAAKAMQGILANPNPWAGGTYQQTLLLISEMAYEYADAMLKARGQ